MVWAALFLQGLGCSDGQQVEQESATCPYSEEGFCHISENIGSRLKDIILCFSLQFMSGMWSTVFGFGFPSNLEYTHSCPAALFLR